MNSLTNTNEEPDKQNNNRELDSLRNTYNDLYLACKKLNPWMAFYGWLYLLGGIFQTLTFIGILSGIPSIIAGLGLIDSSKHLDEFEMKGDFESLRKAILGQRQFFLINGIAFILFVVFPFLIILSIFLTVLLNPDFQREISVWFNNVPHLPDDLPSGLGRGKRI